jgi:hypothetical protein
MRSSRHHGGCVAHARVAQSRAAAGLVIHLELDSVPGVAGLKHLQAERVVSHRMHSTCIMQAAGQRARSRTARWGSVRRWCCRTAASTPRILGGSPAYAQQSIEKCCKSAWGLPCVIAHQSVAHSMLPARCDNSQRASGARLFDGVHTQLVKPFNGLVNSALRAAHRKDAVTHGRHAAPVVRAGAQAATRLGRVVESVVEARAPVAKVRRHNEHMRRVVQVGRQQPPIPRLAAQVVRRVSAFGTAS